MKEAKQKKKKEYILNDSTYIKFQILKANQKQVSGYLGKGKWGRDALLGVLERSRILIGVMVLQMHTYIRTDHPAHLKYVQFISLQLYLNRVRRKTVRDIGNREDKHDRKQTIKCYREAQLALGPPPKPQFYPSP